MDPNAILAQLRTEYGLDCSVVGAFDGYNGGTSLLRSRVGEEWVLKVWPQRSLVWAAQAHRAVDAAKHKGWPSPAWLLENKTADGLTFAVQERAAGSPVSHINDTIAYGIIEANRRQRDVALPGLELFDYGERVRRLLSEDLNGWKAQLNAYSDTANELVHTVLAQVTSVDTFNGNDLVHGDYSRVNILAIGDSVTALVDVDNLGWGNRALDLADAYRQMVLLDDPATARQMIRREIEDIANSEGFYAGFAFWTIGNLAWAIDAKPDEVQERILKLHAFVNSEEF